MQPSLSLVGLPPRKQGSSVKPCWVMKDSYSPSHPSAQYKFLLSSRHLQDLKSLLKRALPRYLGAEPVCGRPCLGHVPGASPRRWLLLGGAHLASLPVFCELVRLCYSYVMEGGVCFGGATGGAGYRWMPWESLEEDQSLKLLLGRIAFSPAQPPGLLQQAGEEAESR